MRDSKPSAKTPSAIAGLDARLRHLEVCGWERFVDEFVIGGLLEGCCRSSTDRAIVERSIGADRKPLLRAIRGRSTVSVTSVRY